MNKLQKLLATKEQIEAELEKERQERIAEESRISRERAIQESLEQQRQSDGVKYGQIMGIYTELKSHLGEKTNDPLLVLSAMLYHTRQQFPNRQAFFRLFDSLERYDPEEELARLAEARAKAEKQ